MQFAGVLTDQQFNNVTEPISTYVKIPDEVVPDAKSMLITGLTVSKIQEQGISEYELLKQVRPLLERGRTRICGFNNIQFDDVFLRHAMYRNLYSAYEHEFRNGNSRMDLIKILRFAASIRPDGIQWPEEDGQQTFKLETLAAANGMQSDDAHDAFADVRNTVQLANLLASAQPRLWAFFCENHSRQASEKIISTHLENTFLYLSRNRHKTQGYVSVGTAVTVGSIASEVLGVDLTKDVRLLGTISAEELNELTFATKEKRKNQALPDSPVFRMRVNQFPVVSPISVLREADAERLGISTTQIQENLAYVQQLPGLAKLLREAFTRSQEKIEQTPIREPIAEEQLYSGGFVTDKDLALGKTLHASLKADRLERQITAKFSEPRMQELAERFLVRNQCEISTEQDQQNYREFVKTQLQDPDKGILTQRQKIKELNSPNINETDRNILDNLSKHLDELTRVYGI